MTTHTTVNAVADAWTLAYTAGGAVTIALQNRGNADLLVRIGASTATSDAATAAAELMFSSEVRSFTLASGDKVHVRPVTSIANGGNALPVTLRS